MAKKKPITKVLSCLAVLVIMTNAMSVSVFALNGSNNSTGNASNSSDSNVSMCSSMIYVTDKCSNSSSSGYSEYNVEKNLVGEIENASTESPYIVKLEDNVYGTQANTPPTLMSEAVNGEDSTWGTDLTNFVFSVVYYDQDNDTPKYIKVTFNGMAYNMIKQNPVDTNYADGCTYVYSTTLPSGTYQYSFATSDGYYQVSIDPVYSCPNRDDFVRIAVVFAMEDYLTNPVGSSIFTKDEVKALIDYYLSGDCSNCSMFDCDRVNELIYRAYSKQHNTDRGVQVTKPQCVEVSVTWDVEENSPPKIVSAFWSLWFKIDDEWKRKDSAVDQEKCTLVAIIENAEGKEVTFNIHECDLPWCHSKTPITTVKASVKNGEATATWIVEWMDDGPLEGDPEYKFEVIVDGVSADSENELRVSLHSTSEWEDMPVGDCQGCDEHGVIKIISAPDKAVKKGQEFEVVIEVSPRMKSGNTYLMFLTNDNIEKTNLFMDKKGIKINQEESKISIDYIEYKDSDVPYALFILLTTFGKLSYPPAFDVADAFSLLGFVTGTSPTPPDMAIELGRSYLLGQRDKIESDIKYIFDKFKLKEAYPLMSMGGQGKNVMNYKLKLKAPYDDGPYKLSLSAKYSILCYKFKPDQEKKMYCLVSTIGAAAGGRLKAEASKAYRGYFKEYTACDSVTIGIGNCTVFTTKCPVDMSIVDPEGLTINKQINEILGAVYTEQDINEDGDPDDRIIIPNPRIGDYEITVIPEPDAKSTDKYTLEVSSVDTTIAIAENVPISEIPAEPYIFKSDQNQPPFNPTLKPDESSPQLAGTKIKWTAAAIDPDGDTLYYRFGIRGPATGNSWTLKRDWSTYSSWTWYTNSADIGDTDISVWIRDGHHEPTDSYDLEKVYFDYTITGSAQGLVAEWRFDEGSGNIVKDSSGNGNDGTVHGATFVDGVSEYALNFDGIDDYVNVKHNEIFNAREQITIEAWINWNLGASGIDLIVDKGGLVYWFIIDSGDAISMCFLDDIENTIYGTGVHFIPYQGKWVHAVGTYDGTDIRLYLNGELVNHYEHKGKITTDNRPLRIGANEHSQDNFEGKIDEVRIYNRALSADEILERYNNLRPLYPVQEK